MCFPNKNEAPPLGRFNPIAFPFPFIYHGRMQAFHECEYRSVVFLTCNSRGLTKRKLKKDVEKIKEYLHHFNRGQKKEETRKKKEEEEERKKDVKNIKGVSASLHWRNVSMWLAR